MRNRIVWTSLSIFFLFSCSQKTNDTVATLSHEDSLVLAKLDELNSKNSETPVTAEIKIDTMKVDSSSALAKIEKEVAQHVEIKKEPAPLVLVEKPATTKLSSIDNKVKPSSSLPVLKNYIKGSSENVLIVPTKKEEAASLSFYEQGLKRFKAGDYAGSIPFFDKAIEINPSNIEAQNKRGMAKAELGAHSDALQDFNDTEAMQKKLELDALLSLAEVKVKTGDYSGAIQDYTYIIGNNLSNSYEIYFKRGIAKAKSGKHEDAVRDFNKTASMAPSFSDAFLQKGISEIKLKNYKGAITDLTEAIKLNPKDKIAFANRAAAKSLLKDNKGALEDYAKSIEIDPKYEDAYLLRADVYEKIGKTGEAINDWSKIIELNPKLKMAYMKRGHLYFHDYSFHQAISDFGKASEIDPKDADACFFKGMAEMESKKNHDACISFKKASQLGNNKAAAMMAKTCK